MRRIAAALLTACMIAALPMSASAKTRYDEPGMKLAPISERNIEDTGYGVVITDGDVYAAGVRTVYFDDREIEPRTDYTVKNDGGVAVRLTQSFLEDVKPGKHIIRVEFASHFAEITCNIPDTEGYYSAEPPKAKWPR